MVVFRVYDPENYRLVQTNEGHTDSVRTIMHITERNQVCLLLYIFLDFILLSPSNVAVASNIRY